jgi:hypothetical protein
MKNGVILDVTRRVALVRNVSEELNASIIRVTGICELGAILAVTALIFFNSLNLDHRGVRPDTC